MFRDQVARCEVRQESDFSVMAESGPEEVHNLRHHQDGYQQRTRMGLEQLKALAVMVVVRIDVGVQRAGVDEQGYRATSSRRISSIRTETSCEPLLPAAEAISLRRSRPPPKWASMASRVSSDTVEPLRSASWRSRASRSSGSFTVVRFMYASIPHHRDIARQRP